MDDPLTIDTIFLLHISVDGLLQTISLQPYCIFTSFFVPKWVAAILLKYVPRKLFQLKYDKKIFLTSAIWLVKC